MLERAKAVTRHEWGTAVEYARFADDLVILVDSHPRQQWLRKAVEKRLREELAKLQVEVNEEKSRTVELRRGESFGFLGFEFRRVRTLRGRWMPLLLPKGKKRTALRLCCKNGSAKNSDHAPSSPRIHYFNPKVSRMNWICPRTSSLGSHLTWPFRIMCTA